MEKITASMHTRADIQSSLSPFFTFPSIRVEYPKVVTEALTILYREYNRAFENLVDLNREHPEDYKYCISSEGCTNYIVQIDMQGLNHQHLKVLAGMSVQEVCKILRKRIFELENSWAHYGPLAQICSNGVESFYAQKTRVLLDSLRKKFNMPIALLAVTEQKYIAMRETEFGKFGSDPLSDEEVFRISGFNKFFGPEDFLRHINENGGCKYLLYCRTSDPIDKLKQPDMAVKHPLLEDPEIRRIIKAHSLTFNVDDPILPIGDVRRINDTKRYMATMDMAFPILSEKDLLSSGLVEHLENGKPYSEFSGNRISVEFGQFLTSVGVDPDKVASGEQTLRAKPIQGTFGCYGHLTGLLSDKRFRKMLRSNLRERGPYIIQPELEAPKVFNTDDEQEYAFIDRVFVGTVDGIPTWMGGHREFLALTTTEAQNGRLHGNSDT